MLPAGKKETFSNQLHNTSAAFLPVMYLVMLSQYIIEEIQNGESHPALIQK